MSPHPTRKRAASLFRALACAVALAGCGEGSGADPGGTGSGGTGVPTGGAGGSTAGAGGSAGTTGGAAGGSGVAGSTGGSAGGGGASGATGRGGSGAEAGTGGSTGLAGRGGNTGSAGTAGGRGGTAGTVGLAGRGGSGGTGGGTSGTGGGAAGTTGAGGTGGSGALPLVTLYLASDSTVSNYDANHRPQAGWGQMLPELLTARAKVDNRAIGGRTSRRFISEGRLDTILSVIKPNDYLFIQFGTNDGNKTAMYDDGMPYYVSPEDFEMYMEQYISGARGKGAIPVLVTPPPRRTCDTANDMKPFGNGLAGYAMAMKNVAGRTGAALIDLNKATLDYLNSIGCAASAQVYLVVAAGEYTGAYANGVSDGTHFQEFGARKLAGFVADGIRTLALPLAAYLK